MTIQKSSIEPSLYVAYYGNHKAYGDSHYQAFSNLLVTFGQWDGGKFIIA